MSSFKLGKNIRTFADFVVLFPGIEWDDDAVQDEYNKEFKPYKGWLIAQSEPVDTPATQIEYLKFVFQLIVKLNLRSDLEHSFSNHLGADELNIIWNLLLDFREQFRIAEFVTNPHHDLFLFVKTQVEGAPCSDDLYEHALRYFNERSDLLDLFVSALTEVTEPLDNDFDEEF